MSAMREVNLFAEQVICCIGQVSLTAAAVILPLLALRKWLRRRYPARVLCLIWSLLVLRLLIPVPLALPGAPVQVTPRLTRVVHVQEPQPERETPEAPAAAGKIEWVQTAQAAAGVHGTNSLHLGTVLFLVWAVTALLLFAGQLFASMRYMRRLLRTAWVVESPALLEAYRKERQRLGIRRELPLLYSREAGGPVLMGLLRPVLLFPAEGVRPEAVPMVLRHELTHYQRRDLWLKLGAMAARCMHWFNPAVYLLVRALFEDIELACDSRAVEGMDDMARKCYGSAILDCAESQCGQTLTTCFTSGRETMKTRLSELFATGVKKRGRALVAICIMTAGIIGGAVSIGGKDSSGAAADSASPLTADSLNEEVAATLAGYWAESMIERNRELVMPYLTEEMQRTVFTEAYDFYTGEKFDFVFNPDAPHYGVPEEANESFWRFGVSSPYVNAYTVLPDLENGGAWLILNWHTSASIDYRTGSYLKFIRQDRSAQGEWRIQSVASDFDSEVRSADRFVQLYGNDLGLPDFLGLLDSSGSLADWVQYGLDDPVTAAEQVLFLKGGHGEVTGTAAIRGKGYGCMVTYTFADGSAVDFTMNVQFNGGYFPVDWHIDGKNSRTMIDLACQWARGTIYKDTRPMFPLLTEKGTDELIAVQQNYSGTEGDEWYWKHGKYGSSPSAGEFGVFTDMGENAVRVTYGLASSGEMYYRESEILRFEQTPAGLKIDSVRELTRQPYWLTNEYVSVEYELLERNEREWFVMHYMEEPAAGTLSRIPYNHLRYVDYYPDFESDPVETAKALLHITDKQSVFDFETHADAVLISADETSACVRFDLRDGSGQIYTALEYDSSNAGGWELTEFSAREPSGGAADAASFAAANGGMNDMNWQAGYYAPDKPAKNAEDALAWFLRLRDFKADAQPYTLFDRAFGQSCKVRFSDGSYMDVILAEGEGGSFYPVDWFVDGKNTRNLHDLVVQWASGVCGRETRLMFPILTETGRQALAAEQETLLGKNWDWTYGRYDEERTASAFALRRVDRHTMEVVYNEAGRGWFNHHSVERLYFTEENGTLRLDHWEAVERSSESDLEWYQTYYEPFVGIDAALPETGAPELQETVRQLAGMANEDGLDAFPLRIDENVYFMDDNWEQPGYSAILSFADGSGRVNVHFRLIEDENGSAVWKQI